MTCRFTAYVYPAVVALLLFGPQDRAHNFGLNFFWAWWWPGIFLVYPFLGRVWCAVCPFMIFGELTQRWQTSRGVILRKWPHASGVLHHDRRLDTCQKLQQAAGCPLLASKLAGSYEMSRHNS